MDERDRLRDDLIQAQATITRLRSDKRRVNGHDTVEPLIHHHDAPQSSVVTF